MSIQIKKVSKQFGKFKALENVDLVIEQGELVALLGPSGSGKTTLLRIIAGLESSDTGSITIDGSEASSKPKDRQVGFVFQHYALFRHMSVFENIAFGLRVRPWNRRPNNAKIRETVLSLLRLVQLEGLEKRYPSQLSGGQRQRVALARALAIEPNVLLLDEPFGALDARVRQELRRWLRRLHDELHMTSVFVTHDQEEALEVADRIVVMNHGKIEQIGTPHDVYEHPANPFVYNFLGRVNLFHGRVQNGKVSMGDIDVDAPSLPNDQNAPVVGYVRPHDLLIAKNRNGHATIEATIEHINPVGPIIRLELERIDDHQSIEAEITRDQYYSDNFVVGETVYITPKNVGVFLDYDPSI
jgi:sulfate/thiosulfate transport system ATP-binding protein